VRDRLTRWIRKTDRPWAITGASVAESTVVPIPIELLITPMMVAEPRRKWRIALWTLLGSVIGTAAMYALGYFFFQTAGTWLIEQFGWQSEYQAFQETFRANGILAVAFISVTAIPLVLAAMGAGAAGMNVIAFLAVVAATRALRYFGLALLVQLFGNRARQGVRYLSEHPTAKTASIGVTAIATVGLVAYMAM
jgi:membrane protein YqaA with SNARE-associated domain